jgi:hypothetical protein
MEKNTKIALGIGVAIALYLILKPKKASATTTTDGIKDPLEIVPDLVPLPSPPNPDGLKDEVKATVEPQTKDCVQVGYDCRQNTYDTIQIPLDADCNDYQPAMPNCAPPMGGGGEFLVAPDFLQSPILSNFA